MIEKFTLEKLLIMFSNKTIINLGAGKLDIYNISNLCDDRNINLINIDRCYQNNIFCKDTQCVKYIGNDIFEFMQNYYNKVDVIIANRIFEHFFYDSGEVGQMLSMCHNMLNINGKLIIIVPNHKKLGNKLFDNNIKPKDVLLLNTEFCNTKSDPHGSIWSPQFAKYYIEQENIFSSYTIKEEIEWENRFYMMIECIK